MDAICNRRRRGGNHFTKCNNPPPQPVLNYVYGNNGYTAPVQTFLPGLDPNIPTSPPPPYALIANPQPPLHSPAPPFYQQMYQSQPASPGARPPLPPRHLPPPLASSVSLPLHHMHPPYSQEEAWQSLTAPATQNNLSQQNDCPIARSMNQGAAFCDRVASRLNDVLWRLESDNDRSEADIEALVQDLSIEDISYEENTRSVQRVARNRRRTDGQTPNSGIINFKKTWMYANSRLPPQMLPFKIYMPTWQILCRAAEASAAVYKRPQAHEREEYVEADWRAGTKAMALKSVCLDEKNMIVFAIRGSKWNLMDWAINFTSAPREPIGFLDDQGNACHAGFLQVARAMVRPVAARLRQLLEQDPGRSGSSLVITGHSAGGAVASLLYMHMLSTTLESELNILTGCFRRVHCVTFGAPPVTLLPLQKPSGERNSKNIFMAFANEGDPIVRADKQYLYCLAHLIAAPAPQTTPTAQRLQAKRSRQVLKRNDNTGLVKPSAISPIWPVPEATLSNAGRLVLLRRKPAQQNVIEAVCLSDEQLRDVIFGDPSMHDMALYKRRIDELAVAAVTGRD